MISRPPPTPTPIPTPTPKPTPRHLPPRYTTLEPTDEKPKVGYREVGDCDFTSEILSLLDKYGYKTRGIQGYTIRGDKGALTTLDIQYVVTIGDKL